MISKIRCLAFGLIGLSPFVLSGFNNLYEGRQIVNTQDINDIIVSRIFTTPIGMYSRDAIIFERLNRNETVYTQRANYGSSFFPETSYVDLGNNGTVDIIAHRKFSLMTSLFNSFEDPKIEYYYRWNPLDWESGIFQRADKSLVDAIDNYKSVFGDDFRTLSGELAFSK